MSFFKNPLEGLAEYLSLQEKIKEKVFPLQAGGMSEAAKAYLITCLGGERPWKLVITHDENNAGRLYEGIGCFSPQVDLYPARDLLFFNADIRGNLILANRIQVWKHLGEERGGIVVATVDALMDKLEDFKTFHASSLTIHAADTLDLSELTKCLGDLGYERSFSVESPGQFSIRGGIIDIFPLTAELPVRIELWDEEIDSMRSFDPGSQRSVENLEQIRIYPAREKELGGVCSFLRYFDSKKSLIFVDEPSLVMDRARKLEEEYRLSAVGRMESGNFSPEEIPDIFSAGEILEDLREAPTVFMSSLDLRIKELGVKEFFSLDSRQSAQYQNSFEQLPADLQKYQSQKYRIALMSPSKTRAMRLAESFREDYGLNAFFSDSKEEAEILPGQILLFQGNLHTGFEFPSLKFIVISEGDIFGKRKKRTKKVREQTGDRVSALSELSPGDYVIHEDHGLGIYRGIEKIERDGITKDYVRIEYQGGASCYVPVSKLDRIQRYAAGEAVSPKLNKLGGTEWTKTKSRVKREIHEMAKELIALYAARLQGQGIVFGKDTVWQREFEEMFEFEETEDQLRAIEDTKRDMETGKVMDRLICGDVGYGKTEIAIRAAFKAVQEGYQVLYLVPTTILARQHYNTFIQRMKDYPVEIDCLSRFNTPKEQKKILEDLKRGMTDIVIGTHRLLSKDLVPKKLGMVIIDEEQRFGVGHKEKLKMLCENVDVLTLTATPIPRTLHMSLAGIRDLSILEEPPMDRKPIQTYVMEQNDEMIKEAIRREMGRGGQVYYVYNRVHSIGEVTAHIRSLAPEARVEYVHGRMAEKELDQKMIDFINGDTDVLVTTTIVETGLDIPNANTMIIHDADRLGLSQLYQLRGRVGRSNRTSYAFLLYRRGKLLSEVSQKRLKAIREFTELGSGIKIAMRDLEIRGAGDVLGARQHGHMQAVGYDLYVKLLNTAIRALKTGKPETEDIDTGVEVDMDAYIPDTYIPNEEQKLEIYKKIALIQSREDYGDMQDELMDRFGELAPPVANLLMVARIKAMAKKLYITDVTVNRLQIRLFMKKNAPIDTENLNGFLKEFGGNLTIRPGEGLWEYRDKQKVSRGDQIRQCMEILEKMTEQLLQKGA